MTPNDLAALFIGSMILEFGALDQLVWRTVEDLEFEKQNRHVLTTQTFPVNQGEETVEDRFEHRLKQLRRAAVSLVGDRTPLISDLDKVLDRIRAVTKARGRFAHSNVFIGPDGKSLGLHNRKEMLADWAKERIELDQAREARDDDAWRAVFDRRPFQETISFVRLQEMVASIPLLGRELRSVVRQIRFPDGKPFAPETPPTQA